MVTGTRGSPIIWSASRPATAYKTVINQRNLLVSDRSKAVVLVLFLLNVFVVGVSCRILYSFVVFFLLFIYICKR